MIMSQNKLNILMAVVLIIFAAFMKVLTYPHSFNPIIAISLFSGAMITDRKMAFAMPLLAMFFSDVIFEVFNIAPGFYGWAQIGNYASLLAVTLLGFAMKKITVLYVVGFSIASSLLFFVLSNTNVFVFDTYPTYGSGFNGWAKCLLAGIPFVKNGLITDLCFSTILFGGYILMQKTFTRKVIA